MNKIFCIGFQKTGTTTLDEALQMLGYRVCGVRKDLVPALKNGDWEAIFREVEKYDAFQDNPWPLIYKELDRQFPGSKFILTLRDADKWLRSIVNHCENRHTPMREWVYGFGNPKGHETAYLQRYQSHIREVLEYFADRPGDLLMVSWEKGDGWEKLCTFLGKPLPGQPFPHANKGDYTPQGKLFKNAGKFLSRVKRKIGV
jgi:hypothetical protein